MKSVFEERLRKADLTGDTLLTIFRHLETIMLNANSGQSALTLGYVGPDDDLQEGDLVPSINVVLTQYTKDEN